MTTVSAFSKTLRRIQTAQKESLSYYRDELEKVVGEKEALDAVLQKDIESAFPDIQSLTDKDTLFFIDKYGIKAIALAADKNASITRDMAGLLDVQGVKSRSDLDSLLESQTELLEQKDTYKLADRAVLRKVEESMPDVIAYNDAYPDKRLTSEVAQDFLKERGLFDSLLFGIANFFSPRRRALKSALDGLSDPIAQIKRYEEAEAVFARSSSDHGLVSQKCGEIEKAIAVYDNMQSSKIGDKKILGDLRDEVFGRLNNEDVVTGLVGLLPNGSRKDFRDTLIKSHGLEKVEEFLEARIGTLKDESKGVKSALDTVSDLDGSEDISSKTIEQADALLAETIARTSREKTVVSDWRSGTSSYSSDEPFGSGYNAWMTLYWMQMLRHANDKSDAAQIMTPPEAVTTKFDLPKADPVVRHDIDAKIDRPSITDVGLHVGSKSVSADFGKIAQSLSVSAERVAAKVANQRIADYGSRPARTGFSTGGGFGGEGNSGFKLGGGFGGGVTHRAESSRSTQSWGGSKIDRSPSFSSPIKAAASFASSAASRPSPSFSHSGGGLAAAARSIGGGVGHSISMSRPSIPSGMPMHRGGR